MAKKKNGFFAWLRQLVGRINYRYVAWVVVPLLLLGAVFLGAHRGWTALERDPRFRMSPSTLGFGSKPEPVRGGPMIEELREELGETLQGRTIFDRHLCRRVAHELQASPWVLEIKEVERRLPNQLNVEAVFRLPAGIVEMPSSRYMIDRQGYWLPTDLYRQPSDWDSVNLPHIVHRGLREVPVRGRPWNTSALAVGARLAEMLVDSGILALIDIDRIDVSNVGGRGHQADVVLFTAADRSVKWGTTDAYEDIQSLNRAKSAYPDRQKLAMLRDILQERPNLHSLQYVDLRYGKMVLE
jgi:hypothetical protein